MMKKWMRYCFTAALSVGLAWAIVPSAAFGASIAGTSHDFTGGGLGVTVCELCHVPHGASSATLSWNHTLSTNTLTFGTGAATTAGTNLPTNLSTESGTSKYCLSCHDGSVAVGDTITGGALGGSVLSGGDVIGTGGNIGGSHPVAIPYPDQVGASYNSILTAADPAGFVSNPTGVKIYGTTAGQKGVECSSCHNPHGTSNPKFLRAPKATLCQSCHNY